MSKMSVLSTSISNWELFEESLRHSRCKSILKILLRHPLLQEEKLHQLGKTFEIIFEKVHTICSKVNGIGQLAVYDLTAAVCRHQNIPIGRVYIIGGGPKRAIELLDIHTKDQKIKGVPLLKYVEVSQIVNAFQIKNYKLDPKLDIANGDAFESYICKWQKNH